MTHYRGVSPPAKFLCACLAFLLFAHGSAHALDRASELAIQGQQLIASLQYEKAVDVLSQALKLDSNNTFARNQLGLAYQKMGREQDAVEAFVEVLKIDPEDFFARTWVEMITQRPYRAPPKEGKRRETAPSTPLEKQARAEERSKTVYSRPTTDSLKYQVRTIVVDPGHGGFDTGAVGAYGTQEKDLTLDISIRLSDTLRKLGFNTYLTRDADYYVPLSERTAIANQFQADLFVSIHINANPNHESRGSEVYFCSEDASNKEAARVASFENAVYKEDEDLFRKDPNIIDIEGILFQFERQEIWGQSSRVAGTLQRSFGRPPFKSRGVQSANFFVLRFARMPSVLVEVAFVSNPNEEQLLGSPDFRQSVAAALAANIQELRR